MINGWNPLTIITKSSILDDAAVLDPPLARRNHVKTICSQCSLSLLPENIRKPYGFLIFQGVEKGRIGNE